MRFILVVFILGFQLFDPVLFAQDQPQPVQRSNEMITIEGKVYYIHVVRSGQTLYGISKAYHVPEKTISEENPVLVTGLQPGQVLKIPYVSEQNVPPVVRDHKNFYYHKLSVGETIYSLSKRYNVTVDEILESNPGVKVDDLTPGIELKIPKHSVAPQRETFVQTQVPVRYYRVTRGETLYSVARKFEIPVREIRQLNKGIRNKLTPGEFIRIPVAPIEEKPSEKSEEGITTPSFRNETPCPGFTEGEFRFRDGRVVMLLPLFLKENEERFYIDSSRVDMQTGKKIRKVIYRDPNWIFPKSRTFLEFYEGARIAVEELNRLGAEIHLEIMDTRSDPAVVDSIIQSGSLDHADLIIGPVYPVNLSLVAEFANKRHIPVVSPLSRNDKFLRFNPWTIQARPSLMAERKVMAEYLGQYHRSNIVLVHSLDSANHQEIEQIKSYLNESLSEYTYPEEISVKEVYLPEIISPRDTVNTLQLALKKDMTNTVWIVSDKESFVSEIVSRLNSMSRNFDIQLFGNSSWMYFLNIQPEYFFNLKLKLFTPRIVNYTDSADIEFLKAYRKNYYTDPEFYSLSWEGYDITKYFLSSWLYFGNKITECIPAYHPELTTGAFKFQRTGWFSGLMNTNFYLVSYEPDYTIQVIKPERTSAEVPTLLNIDNKGSSR